MESGENTDPGGIQRPYRNLIISDEQSVRARMSCEKSGSVHPPEIPTVDLLQLSTDLKRNENRSPVRRRMAGERVDFSRLRQVDKFREPDIGSR